MEIRYKDFAQHVTKEAGIFSALVAKDARIVSDYSSLDEVLAAIASWIKEEHINVLNIETLVLPTSINNGIIQTGNSPMLVSGENSSCWYQVCRVWFKVAN